MRSGATQIDRVLWTEIADANAAFLQNLVAGQIGREFLDLAGQALEDQVLALLQPAIGQVTRHAAEAQVVAHHAAARHGLKHVEDQLTLAHCVEQGREEGAQVIEERADREEVVDNTGQLRHDHADVLGAFRRRVLFTQQLFDCDRIGQVVGHRTDVVQPVGVRHVHQVRVALADLLMVAMEITHLRLQRHDGLAFQFDDHAKHAVGAGVLRTHVDDQPIGLEHTCCAVAAVALQGNLADRLLPGQRIEPVGILHVGSPWIAVLGPGVVAIGVAALERLRFGLVIRLLPVLAHRVAVETLPQQDASQCRMAQEADSKQVVCLTFLQVSAAVHVNQGRQHRVILGQPHSQDGRATAFFCREEMIDDLETILGSTALVAKVINRGQVRQ